MRSFEPRKLTLGEYWQAFCSSHTLLLRNPKMFVLLAGLVSATIFLFANSDHVLPAISPLAIFLPFFSVPFCHLVSIYSAKLDRGSGADVFAIYQPVSNDFRYFSLPIVHTTWVFGVFALLEIIAAYGWQQNTMWPDYLVLLTIVTVGVDTKQMYLHKVLLRTHDNGIRLNVDRMAADAARLNRLNHVVAHTPFFGLLPFLAMWLGNSIVVCVYVFLSYPVFSYFVFKKMYDGNAKTEAASAATNVVIAG